MGRWFRENGLLVTNLALFVVFLAGFGPECKGSSRAAPAPSVES